LVRPHVAVALEHGRAGGRGAVRQQVLGEHLPGKGRGQQRLRLAGGEDLAGELRGRHRHLVPGEERLAGFAVEDPDMAALQHLRHGGDPATVTHHLAEHR
jgi:hypothetical protein